MPITHDMLPAISSRAATCRTLAHAGLPGVAAQRTRELYRDVLEHIGRHDLTDAQAAALARVALAAEQHRGA